MLRGHWTQAEHLRIVPHKQSHPDERRDDDPVTVDEFFDDHDDPQIDNPT